MAKYSSVCAKRTTCQSIKLIVVSLNHLAYSITISNKLSISIIGLSLPATDDPSCKVCLENDSLCIDFNNDKLMDQCWCPNGCSKQK